MRHHDKNRKFGRVKRQRTALLRSLARSLVLEEGIMASKRSTVTSRRLVESRLGGAPDAVKKLHETLALRYKKHSGGYTRIVRLGRVGKRVGDMSRIELIQ